MTRVFLVDDEPLVLIGMQGMLDWAALGCEVAGTARNGAEALRLIPDARPDVVISDIRMPVLDGFGLAEALRQQDAALPALIMLTSYEEFDYVKRSMQFGAVEYLIKMELTAETLTAALERAKAAVAKETALRRPPAAATGSLESYRERLFLQLYGGLYTDRPTLDSHAAELGLRFDAPFYTVAVGALQVRQLPTSQLVTLSTGVTRMAAETLPKYAPCHVTGLDLHDFSVLFPLQSGDAPDSLLSPLLQILIYWFVFSVGLGTQEKNGFPYHLWLMCGMMPWLALNSAILGASASIQQAASIIRNVRIPLSIIPMKAVVRAYYEHLWTMAILLIALLLGGVPVTWHYLELAYYLAASWVLLIGAALLTSSLTAVFRDFGELLQPLMRLLFYVSSVVWAIDGLSPGLQRVMRLNPLVYIIEGYRKCLLYGEGFWLSPGQGAYFWLAALALLAAGCTLHMRLRNRFIDQL